MKGVEAGGEREREGQCYIEAGSGLQDENEAIYVGLIVERTLRP